MIIRAALLGCFLLVAGLILSAPPTTTSSPTSAACRIATTDPVTTARIETLIAKLGKNDYSHMEIVPQLAEIGTPAVPSLIMTLKNSNTYLQSYAAEALGLIGDKSAYEPLKELLFDTNGGASWAKRAAMDALVQIDKDNAYDLVLKALTSDQMDMQTRYGAVHTLCGKYPDKAVPPCIALMNEESEGTFRFLAMWLTRSVKDQRLTDAIIKLTKSSVGEIKYDASFFLAECKGDNVVPRFLELLADESDEVRYNAASGLGKLGDKKAIPALRKFVKTETKAGMQLVGMGSLLRLGESDVADKLIASLRSDDAGTRMEAARQIGLAGEKKATPCLIAMLAAEKDDDVRIDVARALLKMGDENGVFDAMSAALYDSNINVCSAAAHYMAITKNPKATEKLIAAISEPKCAYYAIDALGQAGDKETIEYLENIVEVSNSPFYRQLARNSVAKIRQRLASEADTARNKNSPTTAKHLK